MLYHLWFLMLEMFGMGANPVFCFGLAYPSGVHPFIVYIKPRSLVTKSTAEKADSFTREQPVNENPGCVRMGGIIQNGNVTMSGRKICPLSRNDISYCSPCLLKLLHNSGIRTK